MAAALERAEASGGGGDCVVDAEAAGEAAVLDVAGDHRLLQAREGAGLDNLGGERSREGDEHEREERVGEGEHNTSHRERGIEEEVRASSADSLAEAREQNRGKDSAGEHSGEDDTDFGAAEAVTVEGRTEQYRAEPVRIGARCLRAEHEPQVAHQVILV